MYLLRITFKSFQKINQLKQNLLKLFNFKNIKINGLFQVKNKKKIFTLLKSPHVNKKSREHFIYKNYTPKIDIKFLNIFQLLNFLILFKKIFSKNLLINIKIIKKK
uniref:Ribosomal protein S10 n=1 Tax=Phytophthora captiosa TaxID=360400 RepID=G4X6Q2_9STRA|nr:ribosomal protein S10 [Phytophthora captiosa]AEP41438.1 40S ribosomal protein S10 [Phytophthora captiosa]AEP41439.1 40S ribosomal protein S10 [Phytophthora captiosa]AFQ02241.1 40S ribosomal protein S10 [Phytophthora captiosa]QPN53997.1 ribosomal protein S10 [Phytophthora captiosa]UXG53566.1 ribosomal protein S10 [Phytophthora captiosa]